MSEELKERREMDPEFQWDLSSFFVNDEAWETAFAEFEKNLDEISFYRGKLKDAETIAAYLKKEAESEIRLENLFVYASSRHDEDTRDSKAQAMYSRAYGLYVKMMSAASFAEPEILSLSDAELEKIRTADCLKDHAFYLENLIRRKKHTLTASEEQLLAGFGEAFAASSNAAGALMDADLTFEAAEDSAGVKHELTESNYILLENSQDRVLRRNAFRNFYASYKGHIHTFAATYTGAVKTATAEAAARHYSSSREMAMESDHIPVSVYDNLVDTIHARMNSMYRYERLRKRLLGVDELHYYDLYAPLVKGDTKHYTYEEAQKMVLEAVKPLGTEYGNTVAQAFRDHWIDVYPNKGKRGGAYSSGSYTSNPIILTNFTGTLDSVSTIAHEMGHSIHSWLTRHTQPVWYENYTMFVAEVASTVNENLLIEQLLSREQEPMKRLALLNQYLEGFKGTVYRQTMFAEFEKEAHAMAERGESLDAEALNQVYQNLIRLYFGEELTMDDEVQYEWARIPHFYSPFYVYVYATGYSTAAALSEGILKEGEPAVKRYLEFLSMGSSQYPIDELKHAGVDLTTPAPINQAIDKFDRILEDAEKTADRAGL